MWWGDYFYLFLFFIFEVHGFYRLLATSNVSTELPGGEGGVIVGGKRGDGGKGGEKEV